MEPEKKSSHGALIGSIIIVVILIIGGIYVWQQKEKTENKIQQIQEDQQSGISSEELNNLDKEINETDTNVDVNLNDIQ